VLTSATCGSAITKQSIYLNIHMGLFSLLIQIMSSLAIYFDLASSLVEVNWFASTPSRKKKIMKYHFGFFDSLFFAINLLCFSLK